MTSAERSLRKWRVIGTVAICCLPLAYFGERAFKGYRRYQENREFSPEKFEKDWNALSSAAASIVPARQYPLTEDLRKALDSPQDFVVSRTIAAIPSSVRSSFVDAIHQEVFSMAEPNGQWISADVICDVRLPRRRLVSVAVSDSYCLLFYDEGGFAGSRSVAAFKKSDELYKTVWHAALFNDVSTPADLQKAVRENDYRDQPF